MVAYTDPLITRLIRLFWETILAMVLAGSRRAEDVLDILQMCKDQPEKWKLHVGVLRGLYEVKPIHVINLSSLAQLPFDSAVLKAHRGKGVVTIELRSDPLYLAGKPLSLFRSRRQNNERSISGRDLYTQLKKRGNNISAKVLDHLVEHPELWPESWKKRGNGLVRVFFWDDIFEHPTNGGLYVRCGYWTGGEVTSFYSCLDQDWRDDDYAVSSAS